MEIIQILFIAVALSMDAFAAAICMGLQSGRVVRRELLLVTLFFGGFQGLMPLLGWFLGIQFESQIRSLDHWIAFALLSFIGGKMLYEARSSDHCPVNNSASVKNIATLALATSIDALAVGVTFALVQTPILSASLLIALVTGLLSALALRIGVRFGERFRKPAEVFGGAILILIGLKILIEHLLQRI